MRKILATLSLLLLLAPSAALAQAPTPDRGQAKFSEQRCKTISDKLDKRIKHFDDLKGKHVSAYNTLKARTQQYLERATDDGQDVTQLREHLAGLEPLLKKLNTDYQTYSSKLRALKGAACSKTEADFKASLTDTRRALKTVHQDIRGIQQLVRDEIKPDIRELKATATSPVPTEATSG